MKFTIANTVVPNYLENFKPFHLKTVVVSASGYQHGYSEPFLALVDTGAKLTSISSERMKEILPKICDKHGKPLQPVGEIDSVGVYGKPRKSPLYILPHLYLGQMHFTDVVISVPDTKNYDCLIGRSILHQCVATYNPAEDKMCFDFMESLKPSKQALKGNPTFGDLQLFAESS